MILEELPMVTSFWAKDYIVPCLNHLPAKLANTRSNSRMKSVAQCQWMVFWFLWC